MRPARWVETALGMAARRALVMMTPQALGCRALVMMPQVLGCRARMMMMLLVMAARRARVLAISHQVLGCRTLEKATAAAPLKGCWVTVTALVAQVEATAQTGWQVRLQGSRTAMVLLVVMVVKPPLQGWEAALLAGWPARRWQGWLALPLPGWRGMQARLLGWQVVTHPLLTGWWPVASLMLQGWLMVTAPVSWMASQGWSAAGCRHQGQAVVSHDQGLVTLT